MEEKFIYRWLRLLRQVFCWHRLKCPEGPGPDQPAMHFVCGKCGYTCTDWETEADYYRNLAAQWFHEYSYLKDRRDVLTNVPTTCDKCGGGLYTGHYSVVCHKPSCIGE